MTPNRIRFVFHIGSLPLGTTNGRAEDFSVPATPCF